jgi:hypothetical protein
MSDPSDTRRPHAAAEADRDPSNGSEIRVAIAIRPLREDQAVVPSKAVAVTMCG